jgi:tetratricopeptide (TPR) repeat protein
MIQSSITGDFQKFSAMTIIDRQNLEKILGEQKLSLSGNYSDGDYVRIGKLTNTRYILTGSVTKTPRAYMLELAVTDVESGERRASYPPKAVPPSDLENLAAIKEATAELLKQLGVLLTDAGLRELMSAANRAQVKAETALAKGIEAQRQGTVVEALSYSIQANNYNAGLLEAANRMNILAADISSGNIGQDTRNDIAWRRQWAARLQEAEAFFSNTVKGPQPFYIVYSTAITQGKIDYQKETVELTIWMGFYPDYVWAGQVNGAIRAVRNGLQATGRVQVWGLDWPLKSVGNPSPFAAQKREATSTVVVEIVNDEGKSIGRQTVKAPYGFESRAAAVKPLWQWEGDVVFPAVNANAITDKLTIRISSIDGAAAESAAKQKNISVMPLTEWEPMLVTIPTARLNIEYARNMKKAEDLRKQADEQLKKGDTDLAIMNYTEAIFLNPDNVMNPDNVTAYVMAYSGRASAYLKTEDYNNAIADYTEAIRLDPNNARYYAGRGEAYNKTEDYTDAIADYTQAVRLDPKNAKHYAGRGGAYNETEEYAKALADFTEAIRLDPNKAVYYFFRSTGYYVTEDYNKAIADLTQAIRLDPNKADYYYFRGVVYYATEDYTKAIADYTEAIRLKPDDAQWYNERGNAYYEIKDYNKAIADYEAALRLAPNDAEIKQNLENARRARGR